MMDNKAKIKLTPSQKIKKDVWHEVYKFFPWAQRLLLKLHIIWHNPGRQQYHIGWLAPGKTLQDLEKHLHEKWGFGNHFVAWTDSDQVLSWRKFENFDYQYHIRVFSDGEIRGHHEYTPESKPLAHFDEVGEDAHMEQFKKYLGEFAVYEEYISHLVPDVNIAPDSELTIDQIN
ncbi:MAG: hypothetical protein WCK91_01685 [bacterium]